MRILLSAVFCLAIFACAPEDPVDPTYHISGAVNGDYSGNIYLSYGDFRDTAEVVDGAYTFTGSVDKPVQAWLTLEPPANVAWIYLENGEISVVGDFWTSEQNNETYNIYNLKSIEGSVAQRVLDEFSDFVKEHRDSSLYPDLLYERLNTLVDAHPENSVVGKLLADQCAGSSVLSFPQLEQLAAKLDTAHQQAGDLKMIRTGLTAMGKYQVGKPFPAYADLPAHHPVTPNPSASLTLVDFWASWCGPCRKKHPEMVALATEAANQLQIIGISIDEDREAWEKAIREDGLPWLNLLDDEQILQEEMGIQVIPFNYLLDREGIIQAVNLSLEEVTLFLDDQTPS
ncbi:TlpA disulfide reductase family protein [Lewinella sp. W8]|uniref:TlpA disulfide reductase family protein n=1 Tax=Lewinella sp. W8 TaxID=2528208 RepID=UPI0010678535|nr:TlpA disulfide reductase family protein [Lewinella sp. W8]MTB52174.1 redoxin family protein [Lewinella sp. W8]